MKLVSAQYTRSLNLRKHNLHKLMFENNSFYTFEDTVYTIRSILELL